MGQSILKAERRQLRRAFGERAAEVIDNHGAAVVDLKQAQNNLAAALYRELNTQKADIEALQQSNAQARSTVASFVGSSFRERFRWLILGR